MKIKDMKIKKIIEAVVCVCLIVCLLAVCSRPGNIQLPDSKIPMDSMKGLVVEGERDKMVIPDKYNTGCDETKIVNDIHTAGEYGGLNFRLGSGGKVLAVDFVYGNSNMEDKVVIRDTDFSKINIEFRNGSKVKTKKEIIFENCKFGDVRTDDAPGDISYIFRRCNLTNFGGSCVSFDECYFGGKANDAVNPLQNVTLTNCYISDLSHVGEEVVHVDGTQIYGRKDYDARNIIFKNCRIEAPSLKRSGSNNGCYVNACLMVKLEYNDANDLLFEDCIINGGGYSIYAYATSGHELNNVVFRNIQVGNSHVFGNIYYQKGDKVEFDNVYDAEKLYVTSVWKDDGKIHLCVSNDTKDERTLLVVTEKGEERFTIPGCTNANDMPVDTPFEEMPFDVDIEVSDSGWVICYDSYESTEQQIRFVNWSGENVFRETAVQEEQDSILDVDDVLNTDEVLDVEEPVLGTGQTVDEGTCGKDVFYKLDDNGELIISGSGTMENYNSGKLPPWKDYKEDIRKVVVEEGITSIGSQSFNGYKQLESIELPSTLEVINRNVFSNCSSLTEISIPQNLSAIKERAFIGTGVTTVYYEGDTESFQMIDIESYNEPILNSIIEYESEGVNEESLIEGTCGKDVSYKLDADGTLTISGNGMMHNFSSGNPAPWNEYKERIKRLVVEEGVTSIGSQSCNGYKELESINLPDSLEIIKRNAFQNCSMLAEVIFPKNLAVIEERSFIGTNISTVFYKGNKEAFQKITIENYNEPIVNAIIEYEE